MIYYHRKYFDEMKRVLEKEKQEALLHEDSRVIEQAKSLIQNPSKKNVGGNFFYTNVDIEKQTAQQILEQETKEIHDNEQQENELIEEDMQQRNNFLPVAVRPIGNRFQGSNRLAAVHSESRTQNRRGTDPKWMKQKKGPQFLLDFRRNQPRDHQNGSANIEKPEQNKRLKSVYHFVPTLKPPRNPQMRKIEAYFVGQA